ncbi:MAG: tRNA uridine-5-carboxymethylaminomethyl(34) synthesis GTPase MnmE [Firmicutes bacterium]|nr:tRNA uridine-5-carboxymethylaminomethyl(34) synthesis GTPase MnmE [Bacillota bacterium]
MSHTIAAVSTGNQISAIGILRLSGDHCIDIAQQVFSSRSGRPLSSAPDRKLVLGSLRDASGRIIDQCMAVCSRAPHSYTGEDTVEFHCHGSPAVLAAGLEALYRAGARPAGRGEFTKRAFLNGKLDLTQAEAVIDLIEADTADAAANAAGQVSGVLQKALAPVYQALTDVCSHFHAVLDYPDEDIDPFALESYRTVLRSNAKALYALLKTYGQGRILRSGVSTAIIGKPNAGKSSLLNALAGFDRAIVTDIPGTTRDTVEESVMVGHTRLRLIDTAGIRPTSDTVEAMGVDRSKSAARQADLVLCLFDGSRPLDENDHAVIDLCSDLENAVALINKSDLPQVLTAADLPFLYVIPISAKTGDGLDLLSDTVESLFENSLPCDGSILTNARQYDAVRRAYESMLSAINALMAGLTPDAVLIDVECAMEAMGEVTGATVREDITTRIFERFCVGK